MKKQETKKKTNVNNDVTHPYNNMGAIVTVLHKYRYDVKIDWLQMNFEGTVKDIGNLHFKLSTIKSRVFSKHYDLFIDKIHFATLGCQPSSSVLPPKMIILKVNNDCLYAYDCIDVLQKIAICTGWTSKNITRLDLATDFNNFKNGMNPQFFLQKVASSKICRLGKSTAQLIGQNDKGINYDYIRFGSLNSPVSTYMYNKSKEMKDVKFKQHIQDDWIRNNIDTNKTVWRLEFSVKGTRKKLKDKETEEEFKITLDMLLQDSFIETYFTTLINKYFCFYFDEGQSNVSRNTKIDLFNTFGFDFQICSASKYSDYTRADKIFIKKLAIHTRELLIKEHPTHEASELILTEFVQKKRLNDFYNTKILPYLDENHPLTPKTNEETKK